ncbi:MAG TPA: thioredoxin-like domain-containing protein [Pyrinomonadaceae bacterium]|nr:thioredoxin-like domain-containing protein [Pyrinomonadaceae bacterium]
MKILQKVGFLITLFLTINGILSTQNIVKAQGKVRAPELTGAKSWLNTDKPLSIAGLRGKVVLLDFWTYGCINCIHIIPDLKKLEAKYANNLVVIGVHSAKFTNEGDTENIRQIILRYGLEHPIANDSDFKIWEQYAVNAYPTQVIIDPAGYVVGTAVGEGYSEGVDKLIGATIEDFRKKGLLDEKPLKFALERAKVGDLPLAFPGKVLADSASKRLFISDSNHNRIVVTDLSGKFIETIGSGKAAWSDGDFASAAFNRPQGLALDGTNLYVADTENQRIRVVDLKTKKVSTIGGTGNLEDFTGEGGAPLKTGLRSPWDLSLVGKNLYIAMAGSHQIWRMDLEKNLLEPYAGTRVEARLDGKLSLSGFAQPSGIVSDGKNLFVADSESNIIREINFQKETVETLVGGDLYQFGDIDGEEDDVRLQHPLGVTLYDGKVLIADTYNHKIKLLDPQKRTVKTFLGTGKSGQTDGKTPTFYEPAGLAIADGKLYIADTNNHAIRVVDLQTKEVSTLKIEGLTPPLETKNDTGNYSPNLKENKSEIKEIAANSNNSLLLQIKLPDGYHLNPSAPNRYEISTDDAKTVKIANPAQKFTQLPLNVPFQTVQTGSANLKIKLTLYYCREDNTGACLIKTLAWQIPLKITAEKKDFPPIVLQETLFEK